MNREIGNSEEPRRPSWPLKLKLPVPLYDLQNYHIRKKQKLTIERFRGIGTSISVSSSSKIERVYALD